VKCKINNINITAISCAYPREKFDLITLAETFGESEVKRIINSTGISSVRRSKNSNLRASDLCWMAAEKLLSETNIPAETIDGIIFVSQTPDQKMPATSIQLQKRLGLSKETVTLDANYGCSGYVYGLYLASTLIAGGGCKRVILCAGDVITPHLNPLDKSVRFVFGDGASATLIEKGDSTMSFITKTNGEGADFLKLENGANEYLYMDGAKVMEFALAEVPLIVEDILGYHAWSKEEVGTFALHQPNVFMLNYLRKKMKLETAAVPIAVDGIGNTSSASIPMVLSHHHAALKAENRLKKVVLCGFGVGLSWGACALDLSNTTILSPYEYPI